MEAMGIALALVIVTVIIYMKRETAYYKKLFPFLINSKRSFYITAV